MSFKTESKGKALIVALVKPVAYLSQSYCLNCWYIKHGQNRRRQAQANI